MSEPLKPLSDIQILQLKTYCQKDHFPKGGEMEGEFYMFQEWVPSLLDENVMLKERVAELEKQVKADAGARALWASHFGVYEKGNFPLPEMTITHTIKRKGE